MGEGNRLRACRLGRGKGNGTNIELTGADIRLFLARHAHFCFIIKIIDRDIKTYWRRPLRMRRCRKTNRLFVSTK
jgi:hypothetical protein